jgi:ribonuclease HI
MIKIYTDGSCLKNPGGAGGLACVFYNEKGQLFHQIAMGFKSTTNNRMELMAVCFAMNHAYTQGIGECTIYSDSRYVVDSATKYIKTWRRNNFKQGQVKNLDLWTCADFYLKNMLIHFKWVKAHVGNTGNELADSLAFESAQNNPTHVDVNFKRN